MDDQRFDLLARSVSGRISRRVALGAGAGMATALGGVFARRPHSTLAQSGDSATPAATPAAGDEAVTDFLFVQTAASGAWAAKPGEPGTYLLTLAGAAAQTIYFSDRPARLVGSIPTEVFLASLGFTPTDPPNAAVVVQSSAGEDVLVVELFNPTYDEATGTLTYEARVLAEYGGEGLGDLPDRQTDGDLPATFGPTSLFIDEANCPRQTMVDCTVHDSEGHQTTVYTYQGLEECLVLIGSSNWACCPCIGSPNGDGTNLMQFWSDKCNQEHPDLCNGRCWAGVYCG